MIRLTNYVFYISSVRCLLTICCSGLMECDRLLFNRIVDTITMECDRLLLERTVGLSTMENLCLSWSVIPFVQRPCSAGISN